MLGEMTYDEIQGFYQQAYIKDLGQEKYATIAKKILISNKISALIGTSKFYDGLFTSRDILFAVNGILYFAFSSNRSQALAGLLVLQRWDNEINLGSSLYGKDSLKKIAIEIIHELKAHYVNADKLLSTTKNHIKNDRSDIIFCIEKYGIVETRSALQALNYETQKMFIKSWWEFSPITGFEFDLFAFSYYSKWLERKNSDLTKEFFDNILNFYVHLIDYILEKDTIVRIEFNNAVKDKKRFVSEKLHNYRLEIEKLKMESDYFANYIFASFIILPFKESEDIKNKSNYLMDESWFEVFSDEVVQFKSELIGIIDMLENATKNLNNYYRFSK